MDHSFENLQKGWKDAKAAHPKIDLPDATLVEKSRAELRNSQKMQAWNLAILSVTLLGIAAFFYFVAPVQETLSRIGAALMLIGLIVRISAEVLSLRKSKYLKLDQSAAALNQAALDYHGLRKRIHGTFTTTILIIYVIGVLMLFPEFSLYLSKNALLGIGVASVFGTVLVGFSIRKGIRDELIVLKRLENIQKSIHE